MSAIIQIRVSPTLYLRNPEDTVLGQKIVSASIVLMEELSFDGFTFKKLAAKIASTEASVYRYFKSKHQLLQYLFAWYWSWLEYRVTLCTLNIEDPKKKLRLVLQTLSEVIKNDPSVPHIDESVLHRIVISESKPQDAFTERTKDKDGPAESFESLCTCIAAIIKEYNPKFKYPKALTLTLLFSTHEQRYLAQYFPGITEVKPGKNEGAELLAYLETVATAMLR